MARTVSIQGFKSKLLRPATTSNFYVEVGVPGDEALAYIKKDWAVGLLLVRVDSKELEPFMC